MKRSDLQTISGLIIVLSGFLIGCGSSQSSGSVAASTGDLTIAPQFLELKQGASANFSASAVDATDQTVTWSIQEGTAGGAITNAGIYTAPAVDGVYHVIATSRADPTKTATAVVSVFASTFVSGGNLISGRYYATATLVPSGKVLIAGGFDLAGSVVAGAELFDPVQGLSQSAGTVQRAYQTATLLSTGDVLIAGGATTWTSPPSVTASAELFLPGSGMFQPTGSLSTARFGHTATLLHDGSVLIAAGEIPYGGFAAETQTVELYTPASGTFAPRTSISVPATAQTANLLPNGKVLFTGNGLGQIYDPATDSYTITSSAPINRESATATSLADGRVLLTGGLTVDSGYQEHIYGGPAELYDPVTGQFTTTGTMVVPREEYTATLLSDGTVLIAGGSLADGTSTNTTEIYNPTTGLFSPGPHLVQARAGHTATPLSDGTVLFSGGFASSSDGTETVGASTEIYR